tara:strand:+ start:223 stop:789 length:567 start_codon:yes stop_codon:yes gene_type:complete
MPKVPFHERLFAESKARSKRQENRTKTSNFTFSPKLVSTRPSEGTERIGNKAAGDRLFAQSIVNAKKRKERETKRLRNETVGCTFEPKFVPSNKRRPTRPIVKSSPAAFKRRVRQIFSSIDRDHSGALSLKELKKGMMLVPELSEIIAPGRSRGAYEKMVKQCSTGDGVTFAQFYTFCENATSIKHLE